MPTASIAPRIAAIDLAIVLGAIGAAWILTRWVIYPALGIPDYAPYILRPITGFLVAWAVLHWRGQSLRAVGLRWPTPAWRAVVVAIVLYAVMYAISRWLLPILVEWLQPSRRPSFLGHLRGNAVAVAFWLAVAWLVGGLCEEGLFRGFLLNRVEALLGGSKAALVVAILAQAALFGLLHFYAGAFAMLYASIFGIVNGIAYVIAGRNLVPLIFVHAIWDTSAFVSVYRS